MAKYTSKSTVVERPVEELHAKFSDFTNLQAKLDELPAEYREKIGDLRFTSDSIEIMTPQIGAVRLAVKERTPERITLAAANSPVPMAISVNFKALSPASTEVTGEMDVDIPMMLRPLIGPQLQKAVDQMGAMFASLA